MKITHLITLIIAVTYLTSCSLVGMQNEEKPSYKVILSDQSFEIREYPEALVAQVTVSGPYKDARTKAFKILAGYIFGKNKGDSEISMTSPVQIKQEPTKIAMTSPVEIKQTNGKYTMAFFMPKKFTLETLPEAIDKRIVFKVTKSKLTVSIVYSGSNTKELSTEKHLELRNWLNAMTEYVGEEGHSFYGYNPPWTLPFMRRNEVHINIVKK